MEILKTGSDTLFILLGAIMVLAMHSGFAFLELGTVRKKNQVNALVKIITDFAVSTLAYFFIGYSIAYGVNFFNIQFFRVFSSQNNPTIVLLSSILPCLTQSIASSKPSSNTSRNSPSSS